jgi:hypothetical protein
MSQRKTGDNSKLLAAFRQQLRRIGPELTPIESFFAKHTHVAPFRAGVQQAAEPGGRNPDCGVCLFIP